MMDQAERELFAVSLAQAVDAAGGPDAGDALDRALDDIGWADALDADARTAIATLFEVQGARCASSSALEVVVAGALGITLDPDTSLLLPALGSTEPGSRGIGLSGLGRRSKVVVVVTDGNDAPSAVVVDTGGPRVPPRRRHRSRGRDSST